MFVNTRAADVKVDCHAVRREQVSGPNRKHYQWRALGVALATQRNLAVCPPDSTLYAAEPPARVWLPMYTQVPKLDASLSTNCPPRHSTVACTRDTRESLSESDAVVARPSVSLSPRGFNRRVCPATVNSRNASVTALNMEAPMMVASASRSTIPVHTEHLGSLGLATQVHGADAAQLRLLDGGQAHRARAVM